jgi:hypothetical protein
VVDRLTDYWGRRSVVQIGTAARAIQAMIGMKTLDIAAVCAAAAGHAR